MDFPKNYYGCAHSLPEDDDRLSRYKGQLSERGYDDTETWSLDTTIIKFIAPRLNLYKEIASKVIVIDGEFKEAIDKMIIGFDIGSAPDYDNWDDEKRKQVDEAFVLLSKWYKSLWW